MNDNKIVDAARTAKMEAAFIAGAFPQVQFSKGASGPGIVSFTSFSLFEWGDVMNRYRRCIHSELIKRGHPNGIYEKLRSKAWQSEVAEVVGRMEVAHSSDLKAGQKVTMTGLFGHGFREAEIVEGVDPENPYIINCVHVLGTHGHEDEFGSAYVWEVETVETETGWCPFDITAEEREFKKEADKLFHQ